MVWQWVSWLFLSGLQSRAPTAPSQHRSEPGTKPRPWCKPRPSGGGRCAALGPYAFAPFPLPRLSCLLPTRMEPQQEQGPPVHRSGETPAGIEVPRAPSPIPHPCSDLRAGTPSPTSEHRHSVHRDGYVETKNDGTNELIYKAKIESQM